jgi:surface polysaccharide O-acyltransferase-like enzyme
MLVVVACLYLSQTLSYTKLPFFAALGRFNDYFPQGTATTFLMGSVFIGIGAVMARKKVFLSTKFLCVATLVLLPFGILCKRLFLQNGIEVPRIIFIEIFAVMVVLWALSHNMNKLSAKTAKILRKLSTSIYLVHGGVIVLVRTLFLRLGHSAENSFPLFLFVTIFSIVLSVALIVLASKKVKSFTYLARKNPLLNLL